MLSKLRSRLTYANVVASIALFIALGGTSYGLATGSIDSREIKNNTVRSGDIRNNGVRSGDLRNNDVRSRDIRTGNVQSSDIANNGVTGADVLESSLGTVPSSSNSDTLDNLDSSAFQRTGAAAGGALTGTYPNPGLASPEAPRLVGGTGEPAFQNGWTNEANSGTPLQFYKDPFGIVHIDGGIADGTIAASDGPTNVVFTLPAGYRPAADFNYLPVLSTNGAFVGEPAGVGVRGDNGTVYVFDGNNAFVGLNVTFRATR